MVDTHIAGRAVILAIEVAQGHHHASVVSRSPVTETACFVNISTGNRGGLGRGARDRRAHHRGDLIDDEVHLIDVYSEPVRRCIGAVVK